MHLIQQLKLWKALDFSGEYFFYCCKRLMHFFKPGLGISCKNGKHMFADTFLLISFLRMPWSSHSCNDRRYSYFTRNICNRYADCFKTLFRTWPQACFAIVTTLLDGDPAWISCIGCTSFVILTFPLLLSFTCLFHYSGEHHQADQLARQLICIVFCTFNFHSVLKEQIHPFWKFDLWPSTFRPWSAIVLIEGHLIIQSIVWTKGPRLMHDQHAVLATWLTHCLRSALLT